MRSCGQGSQEPVRVILLLRRRREIGPFSRPFSLNRTRYSPRTIAKLSSISHSPRYAQITRTGSSCRSPPFFAVTCPRGIDRLAWACTVYGPEDTIPDPADPMQTAIPRVAAVSFEPPGDLVYPCALPYAGYGPLERSESGGPPARVIPTDVFGQGGKRMKSGEVSEWLKEHAWKVCIR
jgi:hypothetical protein